MTGLRLLLLVLCAALPGCAGESRMPVDTSKVDAGWPVVVVSVSHDLTEIAHARVVFYLDEGLLGGRGALGTPWHGMPNDFADRRGQLMVLALPPGRHTIDSWRFESALGSWKPKVTPPRLIFDAAAGEILYLGNLHLRFGTEQTALNPRHFPGVLASVVDRSEDDIPLAEQLRPSLRGRIQVRTLPLGPWRAN